VGTEGDADVGLWTIALTTLPAFMYVAVEKWILRADTAVMGAR
jgi:hypothetical protein